MIVADFRIKFLLKRLLLSLQKKKTGKHITEKQAIRICRISENLSSLVQHLAWLIWYKASPDVSDQMIDQAIDELLDQNRLFYQRDMETMTAYQKNFLIAVLIWNVIC